jgi:DNA-directed RNA polymerase subunit F
MTRGEARRSAANIAKLPMLMRKKVDLKEAITMAQDNEYVQKLIAARDREVVHRRDIAERLAEKYNRGDTENMREAFIKIQETIEAIERAVWHERYIAGQKSEPFSPFGFGS